MTWYEQGVRFACRRCGNCCSGKGSFVRVGQKEIDALACAVSMTPEAFRREHTQEVRGHTVLRDREGLRDRDGGDCEWLERPDDGSTRCRVQEAKPDQCRSYPFWPRILRSSGAWAAEGVQCAGIGEGPVVAGDEIERRIGLDKAHEDLDRLFEDVDRAVARGGTRCWARGLCCDFPTAGHTLFATRLEAERFVRGVDLEGWDPESGLCPAWVEGRCTAREHRPVGCRTYFCDPAARESTEAAGESFIAELKRLHQEHRVPWDYRDWIRHLADLATESTVPDGSV